MRRRLWRRYVNYLTYTTGDVEWDCGFRWRANAVRPGVAYLRSGYIIFAGANISQGESPISYQRYIIKCYPFFKRMIYADAYSWTEGFGAEATLGKVC